MNRIFMLVAASALIVAGCSLFGVSDKPSGPDQVAYSELRWTCGGVDGAKAVLTGVRLNALAVAPPASMTVAWGTTLREWGYADTQADALACLFCKVDGKWVGGKFEWISASRPYRDLKNVRTRYAGWNPDFLQAGEFAFVVLSKDGSKRSNVVKSTR